ncbi:MAG: hypothetical protein QM704_00290 [Anaeromyxobacteraceae bacterium]
MRLTDACADGQGLYIRFFDVNNGLVAPPPPNVYTLPSGGTGATTLGCAAGAKVCYGAETPDRTIYWGVGIDLAHSCADCCYQCLGQTVARTLVCSGAREPGGSAAGEVAPEGGDEDPPGRGFPYDASLRLEGEPIGNWLPFEGR